MGALASSGALGHHNLVDQRNTGLDFFGREAEDLSRSLDGSGCIALVIGNVQSNVCHDLSGSLHCLSLIHI